VIAARLGWLQAPADMRQKLADVRRLAEGARRDGLRHGCLLGMGGSSLCAEVLRAVSPHGGRAMSLTVLDTTDERAINQETAAGSAATTLFLVASKSGSTIEVTSLERHFGSVVTRAVGEPAAGGHFVAITDPGTAMVAHARTHRYRETFLNPADIGGRYSALSLFGLVPAALLDVDLDHLLDAGEAMARACREDAAGNPGLALGAFMAENAAAGRDKLTLVVSPALAMLGVWIEQLVAESTGKDGRGLLPVVDEPEADPASYGADRAFVTIGAPGDGAIDTRASALAAAGHPVFRIQTSPDQLGAEFFRWEFATAIAGAALQVNPFDEPNVREAKARTQALLETFRTAGALRVDPPLKPKDGWLIRTHPAGDHPRRWAGRYIALLDYLPADPARTPVISRLRRQLLERTGAATTHGFGPRYLHSTGQYHKGGPNTGLFVLLTAADETTSMVPGTDYSFSVLKQAQALGDFEALVAAGREVIHVHFEAPGAGLASQVERIVEVVTS
jgi:glucose-6-phosphate isomerase